MSRPFRAEESAELAKHRTGLRAVAVFEAAKGTLVLAAAVGLMALVGKDVPEIAERLIQLVHLNPEGRMSHVFLRAAERLTDARLWAAAAGALAYSVVRWVEAWGLWHAREWAEWFALLSGCLYLPWELYEVIARPSRIHTLVLLLNTGIILYIASLRFRAPAAAGS